MIDISQQEFKQIAEYVQVNYGINLSPEKKALLVGRLQNLLLQKGFASFSQYFNYLLADQTGEAAQQLINKLTTNYTFFLREAQHFDFLTKVVLPYLHEIEKKEKDLRIWSAGCSTGEEAYTLAMVLNDYFLQEIKLWETSILATDISQRALEIAKQGVYYNEQIKELPLEWQEKYFQLLVEEKSRVKDNIKKQVIFRHFNLMNEQFPFKKKFHVIFCRNVMIYFDSATKRQLVEKFYNCTLPGGYLFIGHSEWLNKEEIKYKYIIPAVYRKE